MGCLKLNTTQFNSHQQRCESSKFLLPPAINIKKALIKLGDYCEFYLIRNSSNINPTNFFNNCLNVGSTYCKWYKIGDFAY